MVPAAIKIHHLTNLNVYILGADEELIFHHEIISIPSFMPGAKMEDILNLHKEMQKNNNLYSFINQWGLAYLGYSFSEDSSFSIIIGPYLQLTPNSHNLVRKYQLNNHERAELTDFCSQTQLLGADKVQSFASILQLFDIIIEKTVAPIEINKNEKNDVNNKLSEEYRISEDLSKIVNLRYKIEADFLHALARGNATEVTNLLNSDDILFSFSERFPNQPLRRVKNLLIVTNTLFRTVARKKNVPPILIHRISEKFAVQIETKTRLAELQQLQIDMINEYCELIVSSSLSDYSKTTQEVIAYILTYYNKRINLQELAANNFTHPSHLSRKFKQDTGMTITAYQQKVRIHQAKHLLKTESIPIEEVAWMVGYEDSSYFTRVFKKDTGHTPSQYRGM
jgi:AraC-like DNA-binding protein